MGRSCPGSRYLGFLILALILATLSKGWAQAGRMPEDVPADAAKRAAIIDSISADLNKTYIFLDVAEKMERHLRDRLKNGDYDDLVTVAEFARILTEDLQSISHDLHLGVRYIDPERMAEMTAEREPEDAQARRMTELARTNFDFKKVEILPGNIGYLRFDSFIGAEYAGPTAIAAMNFLAHCKALIIDLRNNGGGDPSLIQLITGYFFEEPVHLNSFYIRQSGTTKQFWTAAYVEGPRMPDTDLYVLTSGYTFSGAEEFSYNLKNLERATIVGDTTGGGAHPVAPALYPELNVMLRVPYGRAINPISGTNWEGTGVAPDLVVPEKEALDYAYMLALQKIKEHETDEDAIFLADWNLVRLESQLHPVAIDVSVLESYSGVYGPRRLTVEEGQLYYQREGRSKLAAIPMGDRLFRFEEADYFRIEVVLDEAGDPIKLIGHYNDGRQDESLRSEAD